MLALTSAQTAAIAAPDVVGHVRLFIDRDGTSNMANVCDLEGRDWLEAVEWRDDVDAAAYWCHR